MRSAHTPAPTALRAPDVADLAMLDTISQATSPQARADALAAYRRVQAMHQPAPAAQAEPYPAATVAAALLLALGLVLLLAGCGGGGDAECDYRPVSLTDGRTVAPPSTCPDVRLQPVRCTSTTATGSGPCA